MSPIDFREHGRDIMDHALFAFGDHEQSEPITYYPKDGGEYQIDGIYDAAYEQLDPNTEFVVSGNQITLGIKDVDLPKKPEKGERIRARNMLYKIIDAQEDGVAGTVLFLHEVADETQASTNT